jgi:hypothetical protein
MNSVFELLIKVWTGSRDLKVCVSLVFNLVVLLLTCFFSCTFEQYNVSTDRSVKTIGKEKMSMPRSCYSYSLLGRCNVSNLVHCSCRIFIIFHMPTLCCLIISTTRYC